MRTVTGRRKKQQQNHQVNQSNPQEHLILDTTEKFCAELPYSLIPYRPQGRFFILQQPTLICLYLSRMFKGASLITNVSFAPRKNEVVLILSGFPLFQPAIHQIIIWRVALQSSIA